MPFKVSELKLRPWRQDLGDLEGLARSISEVGLLHPIIVDSHLTVLAGTRRVVALKRLGIEEIPDHWVRIMDSCDPAVVSLHENLYVNPLRLLDRLRLADAMEQKLRELISNGCEAAARSVGIDPGVYKKLKALWQKSRAGISNYEKIEALMALSVTAEDFWKALEAFPTLKRKPLQPKENDNTETDRKYRRQLGKLLNELADLMKEKNEQEKTAFILMLLAVVAGIFAALLKKAKELQAAAHILSKAAALLEAVSAPTVLRRLLEKLEGIKAFEEVRDAASALEMLSWELKSSALDLIKVNTLWEGSNDCEVPEDKNYARTGF